VSYFGFRQPPRPRATVAARARTGMSARIRMDEW
jgi:hypothetical protein